MFNQAKDNFYNLYLNGDVLLVEFDEFIDEWHDGDYDCELHEFLGLTFEEYSLWVDDDSFLELIFESKQRKITVEELIKEYEQNTPMVARANNGELAELKKWLENKGKVK